MEISSLAQVLRLRDDIATMRNQAADLGRQLTTGKKADTFGGLGTDRNLVLSLRAQTRALDGYIRTITQTELRVKVISDSLTRVDKIASELKSGGQGSGFGLVNGTQTDLQINAGLKLDELVSLLNVEIEDRHLFGGRETQKAPVVLPDLILNGDTTHAGLKQVIDERRQADLGADNRGRLVIPAAAGPAVSVSEDVAPSVFGFKLGAVASNLSGTAIAGPAGAPPSLSVTFSGTLPAQGQKIDIDLTLPDGTTKTITLSAETIGPAEDGEFLIGADANTTAVNFQAALDAAVQKEAKTSLRAASAKAATDNFFDFDAATSPQRVNGPPFDTATGLIDGTAANTVFWYRGDNATSPIANSAIAKIEDGRTLSYGTRADEAPIRTTLKMAALLAAESYSNADPDAAGAYRELLSRVVPAIGFQGTRSVADIVTELGLTSAQLDETRNRHENTVALSKGLVEDKENADPFEIGVKLGQLQKQLEASFQVTARLNDLSLVNFIR